MEYIINDQMVSSTWITKETYMKIVERAYVEWLLFTETMRRTKLPCFPEVDWTKMGYDTFEGAKYAERIQCTWYDFETENKWTPDTYPLRRIYKRFTQCIQGLMFIHYLQRYGPIHSTSVDPYYVAYQLIPFATKSLAELQTLARQNYLAPAGDKFELARAIHLSRRWGFNTFAVKSPMNDDVLAKIKSFV